MNPGALVTKKAGVLGLRSLPSVLAPVQPGPPQSLLHTQWTKARLSLDSLKLPMTLFDDKAVLKSKVEVGRSPLMLAISNNYLDMND